MTERDFIERLKILGLLPSQFVVIGSGLLDVLGLRPANDIDIVVSPELFAQLPSLGWQLRHKHGDSYFVKDDCEAWPSWEHLRGEFDFATLLADNNIVDGFHFVSFERLYEWKHSMGRAKDLSDLELMQVYKEQN